MADNNEEKRPRITLKICKLVFRCIMCSQGFETNEALQIHFRQHANVIDIRGRPIDESTLLKAPKDKLPPTELRSIPCEYCSEILPDISKAILHKYQKHRNIDVNHICEQCGKLFPIKIALEQHLTLEHKNNDSDNGDSNTSKSDVANDDGNTSKTDLANDDKKETSKFRIRKLACATCSATFLNAEALKYHQKHSHQYNKNFLMPTYIPPPSKKIKTSNTEVYSVYYCHLCGTEYLLKYNLKKHILNYHNERQRRKVPHHLVRCKTCEAVFFNEKAYVIHLTYHKPDDLYANNEEQRRQLVSRVDQDFDIRRILPNANKSILPQNVSNNTQGIQIKITSVRGNENSVPSSGN